MAETPVLKNYIGGEWVAPSGTTTHEDINPARTSEILATWTDSTAADVQAAVDAAAAAQPAWAAIPAPKRARIFARFIELAEARADELGELMCREEGKVYNEARGEIIKGLNLVDYYVGEGYRLGGITTPSEMPSTLTYTVRQPRGVVGLITPWNFPWAIPCWKVAPALIAGNTAVFKPAPQTPLCAVRLAEILEEAGLPKGVLNVVLGGAEAGEALVTNPAVKAHSFTGSTKVGRRVYELASKNLAAVTCEMGGKNPVLVLDDADLEQAAAGIAQGAFGSTGQRCTATSRLVVTEGIHDALVAAVVERAKALKIGDGMDPSVGMGPAVDAPQLAKDLEYIEIAKGEGATLECGGRQLTGGAYDEGYFVEPTVFTGVTRDMRLAREEAFGPILSVIKVKSFEEGLSVCNDVDYGLTCSIYTRDANLVMKFTEAAEVGMVHINSPTIGGEAQLPFGGIKATGVGPREMARDGIEFFSETKTVFYDFTGARRDTNIY